MAKTGTPTMGGIVFVLVPILVMLILDYKAFATPEMLIVVFAYLGYAFIGFLDDFLIVVKKNNDGLKPSVKFLLQSVLAVVFYICYTYVADTSIEIPVLHLSFKYRDFIFLFWYLLCLQQKAMR